MVVVPTWVVHRATEPSRGFGVSTIKLPSPREPIYSIDIHPGGHCFATGGGDNAVKIWNMAPVLSQEKQLDQNVPRLLCSMRPDSNAVNCVKW